MRDKLITSHWVRTDTRCFDEGGYARVRFIDLAHVGSILTASAQEAASCASGSALSIGLFYKLLNSFINVFAPCWCPCEGVGVMSSNAASPGLSGFCARGFHEVGRLAPRRGVLSGRAG
jgi:hypothetical protein